MELLNYLMHKITYLKKSFESYLFIVLIIKLILYF